MNLIANDINSNDEDNIIATGDFNTAIWSFYYNYFENKVDDKLYNVTTTKGNVVTSWVYNFEQLGTHIDHTFISNNLKLTDIEFIPLESSDHKSIYIEIGK